MYTYYWQLRQRERKNSLKDAHILGVMIWENVEII